jgi:hypothetical protein
LSDQLNVLRKALSALRLKLLDSQWQGWSVRYRLRYRRGHEADVTASHAVYHLRRCPRFRDEAALGVLHELAGQAGGRCLDTEYAAPMARYRFVCREAWWALPVGHLREQRSKARMGMPQRASMSCHTEHAHAGTLVRPVSLHQHDD